jgi:predicted GTPase
MENSQTLLLVVESNHHLTNVDEFLEESMEADVVAVVVALVPWAAAKERWGMQ